MVTGKKKSRKDLKVGVLKTQQVSEQSHYTLKKEIYLQHSQCWIQLSWTCYTLVIFGVLWTRYDQKTGGNFLDWLSRCLRESQKLGYKPQIHGSLNVPIEHHPTIRYMVINGYYKVMSNIPKMGHLPTPEIGWSSGSLSGHDMTILINGHQQARAKSVSTRRWPCWYHVSTM